MNLRLDRLWDRNFSCVQNKTSEYDLLQSVYWGNGLKRTRLFLFSQINSVFLFIFKKGEKSCDSTENISPTTRLREEEERGKRWASLQVEKINIFLFNSQTQKWSSSSFGRSVARSVDVCRRGNRRKKKKKKGSRDLSSSLQLDSESVHQGLRTNAWIYRDDDEGGWLLTPCACIILCNA